MRLFAVAEVVKNYITNNPSASFRVVLDAGFPKDYYGIAVRKGNAELLAKINQGLADIKADGSFAKISDYLLHRQLPPHRRRRFTAP